MRFPIRTRSTRRVVAVAALGLALIVPSFAPATVAAEATPKPVEYSEAARDLATLSDYVKSKKSFPDQILQYLDLVATAYLNMKAPDAPAADASEEDKTAYKAAKAKYDKQLADFQKKSEKQFFKALNLVKVRKNTNDRDDVNLRAATIIGTLGAAHPGLTKRDPGFKHRGKLSKDLRASIERIKKYKHDVRPDILEAAFASLGKLGDLASLDWMLDEYAHTKDVETDLLIAAHKAMILFSVTKEKGDAAGRPFVPGKMRMNVIDTFIKSYTSVESAANTSSSDAGIRAKKKFWDNIKNFTIPVMQHFAHAPKDGETNEAYATMDDFTRWFRKAKKVREFWQDPKVEKK